MIVDDQYFPVRDEVLDSVRNDLLHAVRQGGAFLTFGDRPPYQVEVLITPLTRVSIQRVEQSDRDEVDRVPPASPASEVPGTDVDWWWEWG